MAETKMDELRTFLEVASLGSFAGAARSLGLSTSGVSKQVSTLEERLGVRLLNRTTRRVSLTEVGRVFVARGEAILGELEQLEAEVQGLQSTPRGTLRVSAPQDFGRLHLVRRDDSIRGRVSRAENRARADGSSGRRGRGGLRRGGAHRGAPRLEPGRPSARPLPASSLCLARIPRTLRATRSVAALERHSCIEYEYLSGGVWSFVEKGRRRSFTPTGRLRTNAGWAMREMALAGLGVALLPAFLVMDDLASGALESVLDDRIEGDIELMAVIPHRKQLPAKVRVFIDFLVSSFASERWMTQSEQEPSR